MLALLFNGIALKHTVWNIDISLLQNKNENILWLFPSTTQEKVKNIK